jgi:hypothetical protein
MFDTIVLGSLEEFEEFLVKAKTVLRRSKYYFQNCYTEHIYGLQLGEVYNSFDFYISTGQAIFASSNDIEETYRLLVKLTTTP